jgi:hypothetical protein
MERFALAATDNGPLTTDKSQAPFFLLLIARCYVIQYTPLLLTEKVSSLLHASLSFSSLTRLISLPLQVKWCLPQTFLAF